MSKSNTTLAAESGIQTAEGTSLTSVYNDWIGEGPLDVYKVRERLQTLTNEPNKSSSQPYLLHDDHQQHLSLSGEVSSSSPYLTECQGFSLPSKPHLQGSSDEEIESEVEEDQDYNITVRRFLNPSLPAEECAPIFQEPLQDFADGDGESRSNEEAPKEDNTAIKDRQSCGKHLTILIIVIIVLVCLIIVETALLITGPKWDDVPQRPPPCDKSWIWADGNCYYFSNSSKSWEGSRAYCAEHNTTLAELRDPGIEYTIKRYKENLHYWVGLKKSSDGTWGWLDGTQYNGSIDNDGPSLGCAFLNSHLGALDCSTPRFWICVKESQ